MNSKSGSLDQLLLLAQQDARHEQTFFQALLNATVYAHIPVSDRLDTNRIRFIQFHRPENGQLVLPFFSDEKKAELATGKTARIVALKGRRFMEITQGATLMLNPNDHRCILFPEEIESLLRTGFLARIEPFTVQEGEEPLIGPPMIEPPAWLIDTLTNAFSKLPFIKRAYIVARYRGATDPQQTGYLIALGGDSEHARRAIHAATTVLQPLCQKHDGPSVDMTYFDYSKEDKPDWVTKFELKPFYDHTWGMRLQPIIGNDSNPNA